MLNSCRTLLAVLIALTLSLGIVAVGAERLAIVVDSEAPPRVRFGAQRLNQALLQAGYDASVVPPTAQAGDSRRIILQIATDSDREGQPSSEGYRLRSEGQSTYHVTGFGASGVLYGCLELAERVAEIGTLPAELDVTESPAFKLRGPCIGMQLTSLLPGRDTYEYPYTPENFPFFYDTDHWIAFLDMLVEKRLNTLYLWNGHPFASLVKLEDYPYAL